MYLSASEHQAACGQSSTSTCDYAVRLVGLDQRSYSTPSPVSTWMDDRLRAGKPSRCVIATEDDSAFYPP